MITSIWFERASYHDGSKLALHYTPPPSYQTWNGSPFTFVSAFDDGFSSGALRPCTSRVIRLGMAFHLPSFRRLMTDSAGGRYALAPLELSDLEWLSLYLRFGV